MIITATRIAGINGDKVTGTADLAIDRDDEFVYVKLGLTRVKVPLNIWREMAAKVNLP
jgi:hypothetical protein